MQYAHFLAGHSFANVANLLFWGIEPVGTNRLSNLVATHLFPVSLATYLSKLATIPLNLATYPSNLEPPVPLNLATRPSNPTIRLNLAKHLSKLSQTSL